MILTNDFQVDIATGKSRMSKKWKNEKWQWGDLVTKCSETKRTGESVSEYMRMGKDEQTGIKDVGGFVGGYLSDGRRKKESVEYRTMATLDIDYGTPDIWEDFTIAYNFAALMYSTHKHTQEKPRYRLVIPFNRPVSLDEYEPICRRIADTIGINAFDVTTYQVSRLFYWPSTSRDGSFVFEYQDAPACNVDDILSTYQDYRNASEWPTSTKEGDIIAHEMRKAGDPLEKPGLIGAFCRAYTIDEAIEKFLPEVYESTAVDGRYTYRQGSVAGGLVCYGGKFAYSHHETDPASMQLCNAFDLCRIHLFGVHDDDTRAKDITKLPSYLKMLDFAAADKGVKSLMSKERDEKALTDFSDLDMSGADGADWRDALECDKKGAVKDIVINRIRITLNDKHFKAVRYDLFAQRDVIDFTADPGSPFRGGHGADVDDAALTRMAAYMEQTYQLKTSVSALMDKMLLPTVPERGFNPVIEFIGKSEEWDKTPRLETLLIDYLGAEDTPLTRAITRKIFVAAVARAIDPGCKFDYCLVLQGEQGTGKSTFISVMAGDWLGSLSLSSGAKEQCEELTSSWIVEIPELKGMRRADIDTIKDLISRQSDNYRAAYARVRTRNPRHCVFMASTNDDSFLRDTTGNRRFWIVPVKGNGNPGEWKESLIRARGQIWRETRHYYEQGEKLYLDAELERQARGVQEKFTDFMNDTFREYLAEWLDILIRQDWDLCSPEMRLSYYKHFYGGDITNGSRLRETVTVCEIRNECPYKGLDKYDDNKIRAIIRSLGWEPSSPRRIAGYKNENGWGNKYMRCYRRPNTDPAYNRVIDDRQTEDDDDI